MEQLEFEKVSYLFDTKSKLCSTWGRRHKRLPPTMCGPLTNPALLICLLDREPGAAAVLHDNCHVLAWGPSLTFSIYHYPGVRGKKDVVHREDWKWGPSSSSIQLESWPMMLRVTFSSNRAANQTFLPSRNPFGRDVSPSAVRLFVTAVTLAPACSHLLTLAPFHRRSNCTTEYTVTTLQR